MEDIEQLYITLRNSNLTNKSFKEFVQLYEDDDYKSRVHDAVVDKGLYSGDFNKFTSDYAMPVAPTVPSITSVTDEILKIGSDVFDKLSVKLNTPIDDIGKSEYQFNQEIKDIDEDVLNKINTQLNKIKEQSLKQRASLGETRPLNATNLVDFIQANPEQGITEEVLKKYKTALSKKEEVKINDTFTKENFPQKTIEDSPYLTLTWDNYYSQKYAGKANPKINGIGIHDHMFAAGYEDNFKLFREYGILDPGEEFSRAVQYLTEAYPDYSFKVEKTQGTTMPYATSSQKDTHKIIMTAPNGNSTVLDETTQKSRNIDETVLKTNLVDFVDKNGINIDAYKSLYYKQDEKFKELDEITALKYNQITKLKDLESELRTDATTFDIKQEVDISRMATAGEYDMDVKYEDVQPYKEELEQAKQILLKQQKIDKELYPDNPFIDGPISAEDIQDKAIEIIINNKKAEYKRDNLTNYLEANEDEKQAAYRYYANAKSDRKNTSAIAAQLEFENVVSKSDSIKNDVDFMNSVLAGEKNIDPNKATGNTYTINNNLVDETTYNLFLNKAKVVENYKLEYDAAYEQTVKTTDALEDLNLQLNLLGRDYDTLAKFGNNIKLGFASIAAGLAYSVGKVTQGATWLVNEDAAGDIGDFLGDQAMEFEDWKQSSRDEYALDVSFDNAFNDINSFGRFVSQEVSTQIPILTTIIATGGTASPFVIGGYTFGEKYMSMDAEDYRTGNFRSESEKFLTSLGYGASEAIFGTLPTSRILGRGQAYIRQAGKKSLLDYRNAIKLGWKKQLPRVLVYEPLLEGGSEGLTQMTQNLIDGRPIMENVDHAFFSGGMMGVGMSTAPVITGMAMSNFQSPALYTEYMDKQKQIGYLNEFLNQGLDASTVKNIEKQKAKLQAESDANLRDIENLTINDLSKNSFNKFNEATVKQEELRTEAKDILESNDFDGNTELRDALLTDLSKEFDILQYKRDLFRNHKSFGNAFALMENGTEAEQVRYQELKTQAEENIRSKKDKSPDYIPDNAEVMNEAYDLFVQDNIESRINSAKKSNGVSFEVARTNQDAKDVVNNSESLNDKQKQEIIEKIEAGTLNGVDDIDGKSYVFMENAISNERTSTIIHEPGHQVFKKILGEGQADFKPMVDQISAWLKNTDPDMLNVIIEKQSKSDDAKVNSEEFVMEFLEQVDQGNINFDKTNNKRLASLFGYMTTDVLSKNGGFDLEIKGEADAVNFLVNLAAKIRTGTLTETDIQAAKESDVIKSIQTDVESKTGVKTSLESRTDETSGEKQKRQDKRNTDVAEIYDESAEGKTNKEWREFLDTPRGSRVLGNMINMYYPDMVASAIRNKAPEPLEVASESIEPLIKHIKAFNPQQNTDLAGYVGSYLGLKVGTGAKRVAAKTPTISMEKEGVREVAEKQAVEETTTKETKPVREGIKLAERLGDDAKKISEKVKKMKPVLEGKTYKTLKDLAPDDTQRMFGITPKPGNLTKADVKNAQAFIRKNADILLAMLPEGTTVGGKATGVQKVLLDAFYTKGRRVKAAKTGSKAGLATQTKRPDIKISEFLEVFGITPAGQPNVSDRNTSSRIKALVDQTGKLLTNQAIREVAPDAPKEIAEGKSRVMFSEDVIKPRGVKENIIYIQEQAGVKPLQTKGEERIESVDYLMNEYFPKLIEEFGDAAQFLLKSSTISPSGNEGVSFNKDGSIKKTGGAIGRDQLFINTIAKTIKSKPETQKLLDEGKLGQLQDILNLINNQDLKSNPKLDAIKTATLPQKTPNLQRNIQSRNEHKEGSKAILDTMKKMYDSNKNFFSGIAFMLYNANANSAMYRNLAQLIGFEKGSGKNNAREEHMYQAGPWAQRALEAITKNKKVFDAFNKWQADNYYQETITKNSEKLVDGKYQIEGGGVWNAKSQEHPYMKEQMDIAMRTGDFSNVPSPDLRKYNEYFHLNPNNIIREGISDAKRYNVEVSKSLDINPDVVALQSKLIYEQIIGKIDAKTAKAQLELALPVEISKNKTNQKVNVPTVESSKVMNLKKSEDMSSEDVLNKAASLDEALRNARNPKAPVKKIRVFDFDDTLARTKSNVLYTMPDGTTGKLTAEEFAQRGDEMLAEGAVWDFSEFNKVMDGKKGPLFEVAKKIQDARGSEDIFVLTARAPEASPAIKEFLDAIGLNLPIENISGLGDSSPFAKSNWIVDKAAEGYNDFYFADDHMANVKAVRDALEVLDVKSKVQQAKIKFSEDMNMEFNTILEESKGVDRFKVFSDVKAKIRGARARRQRFFIPPSAEDFQGLLYPTLGKGKQGERHLEFYDKALFKPYAQAMENLATDRNNLMQDFKALKKDLDVPKDLRKQTKSGFTNEQAVRVYLWNKTGQEIPGISKTDLKELTDIIENDPKLKVFADQILSITKGDGYSRPGRSWQAGTITTDLIQILNETKRAKYLETWQENVDIIFSKDNMNKLEAIFGPKYVEALKHSLARMKVGRNRIEGGNRLSNRVLDYINNSTGAIMFFNMRSALLQTISAANFINWSFNNPAKAGIAFANQPQYWKDFVKLMNSDYLTDRRNGLKLNINESEIADAAKTSKNKAKAVVSYIIEKGYIPTKFADSFAIATGGATFYRNRINDLIKNEGLSESAAEKQAMQEFRKTSEISQQSSDPSRISQQQSTDLGRIILQFVNTPMQYARIQKRAVQDLANRRGDDKTNISKIAYYGVMQNLMFNALQQGLFALGFGAFGEEEENKKIIDVANGGIDSLLRGIGFAGVTVQTLKNLGIDIFRRSKKDRPEYGDAWMKLLDFSPAIKSKVSKLRQAAYPFDSKKRRQEVFDKGFSLDNPAYESLAKVITAATNVPIDRLFSKVNNIKGALDEENETWQSIAMVMGWPGWQIQPKEKPLTSEQREARNEANKIQRKKDAYKAAKGSTDYDTLKKLDSAQQIKMLKGLGYGEYTIKKAKTEKEKIDLIIYKNSGGKIKVNKKEEDQAKYKALNKDEQVAKLDSLGLSKEEIKALKYEKDRVKKLLELMEK